MKAINTESSYLSKYLSKISETILNFPRYSNNINEDKERRNFISRSVFISKELIKYQLIDKKKDEREKWEEIYKNEIIKSKIYKHKIDYQNKIHLLYLNKRKNAIKTIKNLVNILNYDENILYNAIDYLDRIYLNTKNNIISIDLIDNVCIICVLLSLKYNGYHLGNQINNNSKLIELVKIINNYKELEINCLQLLDYELGLFTTYDYIINFFNYFLQFHQFIRIEIYDIYYKSINLLSKIIDDERYLDFDSYVLPISIIKLIYETNIQNSKFFQHVNFLFDKLFNCNYDRLSLLQCEFVLHYIVNFNYKKKKCHKNINIIIDNNIKSNCKQINCKIYNHYSNNNSSISTIDSSESS